MLMTSLPDIISGVLPQQEASILAGASGAGKTTLIMQMLKDLLDGRPVFGHPVLPHIRVGYIAGDRTWRSYQSTAERIGLDLNRIKVKTLVDDLSIDLSKLGTDPMHVLSTLISQLTPVDLVVVDPLIMFLGCNTNLYNMVASKLIQVNRWCIAHSITILGTHHASKARTDFSFLRPQDRINGTGALLGFTSTQMFLTDPQETEDSNLAEFHIIPHTAKPHVVYLQRDDNGLFIEAQVHTKPMTPAEKLPTLFQFEHQLTYAHIIDQMKPLCSERTAARLLAEFTSMGLLVKTEKGYALGTTH
jgi:RecA-family ATPase